MADAEAVVVALAALGEAGEAVFLAQGGHAIAPPGQDLVRVGLVADVPDQPVGGGVEDVVQTDRQLDHAEPGREMTAGLRDGVDEIAPQLVDDRRQQMLR